LPERTKLLVISPHLDDAVFGCSALIASLPGAVVVTVFAGYPERDLPLTEWDASCGFVSGCDAVSARRREDRAALDLFGAHPCWLGCLDSQYRAAALDAPTVTQHLRRALARHRADCIAIPLGLYHSDHILVHRAALPLAAARQSETWLVYEDALYRRISGLVEQRCAELTRSGVKLAALAACPAPREKERAVGCYASQLRGLASAGRPGYDDTLAAERYWVFLQ
jgi:LmbE family N-acetylglucosaminyl deacetylase